MRVLVVEDDVELADAVARGLRGDAMAVDLARDGRAALMKAHDVPYDVIVLDRDIPPPHGDDVCRQLAGGATDARILMLTAAATVEDRVAGLHLGADDYLTKPFALAELSARVRALARRSWPARPPQLNWAELTLDPATRTATRAGGRLGLTNREFGVLEQLMIEPGRIVSAEELMERVWDDGLDPFSNAVRVTIQTLRRKLGEPALVATVVGRGYRLERT